MAQTGKESARKDTGHRRFKGVQRAGLKWSSGPQSSFEAEKKRKSNSKAKAKRGDKSAHTSDFNTMPTVVPDTKSGKRLRSDTKDANAKQKSHVMAEAKGTRSKAARSDNIEQQQLEEALKVSAQEDKKARANAKKTEKQNWKEYCRTNNLIGTECGGGGNCGYHTLGEGVAALEPGSDPLDHGQIRHLVTTELIDNAEYYKEFVSDGLLYSTKPVKNDDFHAGGWDEFLDKQVLVRYSLLYLH